MFWVVFTILYVLLGTIAVLSRIFIIKKVQLHSDESLICTYIHAFTSIKMGYKIFRLFFLNTLLMLSYFFLLKNNFEKAVVFTVIELQ